MVGREGLGVPPTDFGASISLTLSFFFFELPGVFGVFGAPLEVVMVKMMVLLEVVKKLIVVEGNETRKIQYEY